MTQQERKTREVVASMLKENTGRHMLDSGGAYGRHWEENQTRNFENEPETVLRFEATFKKDNEVTNDWYIDITHNVYHWLVSRLEYAPNMQQKFNRFANKPEMKDEPWEEVQNEFIKFLREKHDVGELFGYNTYNGEDCLSQVLQYAACEIDDEPYIFLRIHNGCDVKGGYTAPKIFQPNGHYDSGEYTLGDNASCSIYCNREDIVPNQLTLGSDFKIDTSIHSWYSEDGGSSWSSDNSDICLEKLRVTNDVTLKGYDVIYVDEEKNGYCPICGSKLFGGF